MGKEHWSFLPEFKLPKTIEAYSIRSYFSSNKSAIDVNSLDNIKEDKIIQPSDLAYSVIFLLDEIN